MTRHILFFLVAMLHAFSYANDECINAITLTPGTVCNYTAGSFNGATMSTVAPTCGSISQQDVWYQFTATDTTMRIELAAKAGLDHGFELIQGGCGGTVLSCVNSYGSGYAELLFDDNFIPGQVYYIRVFNGNSSLSTATFQICVTSYPPPANDHCNNATVITPNTTCNYVTGTFSGSMMNTGAPTCGSISQQDVWYQFTATDTTMRIELAAKAGLDHGFELIQGGCGGTVLSCVNSYGSGYAELLFDDNFIPGQVYYIRVFNGNSSLSTATFQICVTSYPPPSNDHCSNATVITPNTTCNYVTGTFSGSMMNTNNAAPTCGSNSQQDVWYQFTATDTTMRIELAAKAGLDHGFELIQGGCGGTVLSCVNSYGSGYAELLFDDNFIPGQVYYIRVFNGNSSLSTATFQICVTSYPPPSNDHCSNATVITPNTTCNYVTGTFSGSMMNTGAPTCGSISQQDVWYQFTATDTTMRIELAAKAGLDHGFELIQGGCGGTVLSCVNSYGSGYAELLFDNNFIPGQVYYIRVFNGNSSLSTSTFQICVTSYPPPANDHCSNATVITPNTTCNYVTGTFSGSMMNTAAPTCGSSSQQDVWYQFTATSANMSVQLSAVSGLDHGFELIQGGCGGTVLTCVNGYGNGYGESTSLTSLVPGQVYYIRVFKGNSSLSVASFGICLTGPPPTACTPAVSISASSVSFCQGTSVTFTASPTNGGTSPSYQWQVNGVNSGTNSSTFTTAALSNGNTITCTMLSNASCASPTTTTSNTITVNVTPATLPTFTQVPAICSGESFTLPSTSTNGINGTWSPAVNNTATTTYTFTPASGQCASTATMTVTVNSGTLPTFTQVPAICSGESFTLPSTSTNGINGTWSPAVNNTATTTYTFTPASGQCASTATMTVTVNSGTLPTFTQVPAICSGESFTLPSTSTNGINGTWSPALNNTTTTTYTFTPTSGQCASTATMTVTVNAAVTPAFDPIPAICSGESFTLPSTSTNGINGTWSPAMNNTATTIYTFTPTSGQCVTNATLTVPVTVVNTVVSVTGNTITAQASGATFRWIDCVSGQVIQGAVNASFTAVEDGLYAVEITQNNCIDTSDCITILGLGLETPSFSGWKLWPNPASDQIRIETVDPVMVSIMDMAGKTVMKHALNSGINTIDVSSVPQGIYLVRSSNGAYLRFVKK